MTQERRATWLKRLGTILASGAFASLVALFSSALSLQSLRTEILALETNHDANEIAREQTGIASEEVRATKEGNRIASFFYTEKLTAKLGAYVIGTAEGGMVLDKMVISVRNDGGTDARVWEIMTAFPDNYKMGFVGAVVSRSYSDEGVRGTISDLVIKPGEFVVIYIDPESFYGIHGSATRHPYLTPCDVSIKSTAGYEYEVDTKAIASISQSKYSTTERTLVGTLDTRPNLLS